MRISDWSSDVCSSDLFVVARFVDKIAGHFFGVVRFKHSCSTRNQTNTETVGKEKAICLLHCCKLVMCGHAQFDAHGGIDVYVLGWRRHSDLPFRHWIYLCLHAQFPCLSSVFFIPSLGLILLLFSFSSRFLFLFPSLFSFFSLLFSFFPFP